MNFSMSQIAFKEHYHQFRPFSQLILLQHSVLASIFCFLDPMCLIIPVPTLNLLCASIAFSLLVERLPSSKHMQVEQYYSSWQCLPQAIDVEYQVVEIQWHIIQKTKCLWAPLMTNGCSSWNLTLQDHWALQGQGVACHHIDTEEPETGVYWPLPGLL